VTAPPSLGRSAYRGLACYVVDQAPVRIDLRDNTNLWGAPPSAMRAIAEAAGSVCRYPLAYASGLQQALADYLSIDPGMVVTGCGSDDVIDASFRALGDPGDRIGMLSPSFSSAVSFARTNALTPVPCPLTSDWRANVDRLVALDARLIYVCSPNNPTGGLIPRHAMERLLAHATGVVIIDEAYAEYAGVSACDLLGRFDHLLVIRTLSKAFGLAGLRVGYAVGHPPVVTEVAKARGPYKVNGIAERAAVAALSVDRAWVSDRVRETIANRERLGVALRQLGLEPLPSEANFLCCPTSAARALARRLAERGIGVRLFIDLPHIGDAIRITVGPWQSMQLLLDALAQMPTGALIGPEGP
jgi:histidinol-phosphate aminotransferase